tara:strand:+ start:1426 stop:1698 length:273 start_codon:yes stop_codon:yes gene_type:complete
MTIELKKNLSTSRISIYVAGLCEECSDRFDIPSQNKEMQTLEHLKNLSITDMYKIGIEGVLIAGGKCICGNKPFGFADAIIIEAKGAQND